ncbi:MAG: PKD domain-containing protein [Cyclobacteriaceae bacterium]
MKKLKLQNLALIALFAGMLSIYSCSEDEKKTPAPVADFTVSIEGKVITLENTSTDGETYAWDFGDGGTSTEMSPSYTFVANGSYVISLTVTNETGEDSKSSAIEIVNINIDGDFSDWDNVPAAATYTDGESGVVKEVKIENLEDDKLFIYVETNSDDNTLGFMDFYLNSNNDETGFATWYWPTTPGFDIWFEGYAAEQDTATAILLFQHTAPDSGWGWTELSASQTFIVRSKQIDITGGKAFEFSIALSELPASVAPTDKLKFGFDMVYTVDTWQPLVGVFPIHGTETAAAFEYELKLN